MGKTNIHVLEQIYKSINIGKTLIVKLSQGRSQRGGTGGPCPPPPQTRGWVKTLAFSRLSVRTFESRKCKMFAPTGAFFSTVKFSISAGRAQKIVDFLYVFTIEQYRIYSF